MLLKARAETFDCHKLIEVVERFDYEIAKQIANTQSGNTVISSYHVEE